jgi:hypothetical protein
MSVDCRGVYLVLFGTSAFSDLRSERLLYKVLYTLLCDVELLVCYNGYRYREYISGAVHELALPQQYNKHHAPMIQQLRRTKWDK